MTPSLNLMTETFPGSPALDTAVSRALLHRVAAGKSKSTLRLYQPEAIVAFGRQDAAEPGFAEAVKAARDLGFASIIRLAGGRAAVFHEETIAFGWATRERDPHARTFARFEEAAELFASALRRLRVDARVGEVPGEYCPGDYTVNARGKTKIVGIGQRIVSGGAHVGGVVVASGAERIREVLVPVYKALGLEWIPETAGSIEDEVAATRDDILDAILAEFATRLDLELASIDSETLDLARTMESDHRV